ncbi:MAG: metallophosphoesterase [Christensenellaceae bacterium]|jgi:predicted MPP superfamily phosphohydrolase|nr:metallophosphoesterase [Christensenellaceae bacterium]
MTIKKRRKLIITIVCLILFILLFVTYIYLIIPLHGRESELSLYEFDKDLQFCEKYGFNIDITGEEYKILYLSDLHYLGLAIYDSKIDKNVKALVKKEAPDLIVLLGDQTSSPFNEKVYRHCVSLFDSFELPWALVFGNHDDDWHADKAYLSLMLRKSKYLLYLDGPNIGGLGNYFINFRYQEKPIHTLYLMDSDDNGVSLISKFDWKFAKHRLEIEVDRELLDWYEWAVAGNNTSSTIATHIPLLEYEIAYDNAEQNDTVLRGLRRERNDSYEVNIGLFDKITALKSTKAVIAGHNHKNDFAVIYQDVQLMHCVTSGFTTDGVDGIHGGTVSIINKDGTTTFDNVYYD